MNSLIIIYLIFASSLGSASPLLERAYGRGPDPDGEVDFIRLEHIIAASRAQTIDELLAHLPEEWRCRQVLVFRSRSLQEADYLRRGGSRRWKRFGSPSDTGAPNLFCR